MPSSSLSVGSDHPVPSSFDLKDADGNILMSVDNAKYDDEFYSQDSSEISQTDEDVSDPEEESNSNKRR